MDISTIAPVGRPIEIKHPATHQPTGLVLHLLPFTDPKVKAVQRKITNARLNRRNQKLTAEQIEANSIEIAMAAVSGWEWKGDASFNGQKLAFDRDNLRTVLSVDWIRSQVDEELGDESGFFEASPQPSATASSSTVGTA
jgi:hypothetical protein